MSASHTPINKGQFLMETPERIAEYERRRGFGVEEAYARNRRDWSALPLAKHVADFPLHVDAELASICNLRCPMCYTITDEFKSRVNAKLMDYDLFSKIVDECAAGGVYSLRLSLRGEAFLHPRLLDCVRYAKAKGIPEVSSLTNGARIDEAMFTDLMEAGMDWITFSIDGIGKVYEDIRRPNLFDRMVEKLTNFKAIKEAAGRVKPVIKVQTILPAIEGDPRAFYDIFAPISDQVASNPLIDFMEHKEAMPKIADFCCPMIYQRLVIGADGLVMMCANDETGQVVIGDANGQTIHELWHGETLNRIRRIHESHRACAEIAACNNCYLPIEVRDEPVRVGERTVTAQKYVSGRDKVADLATPDRWKRKDLDA